MALTCPMRHAHVCRNARRILSEIAPSHEVVTHGRVNRQLLVSEPHGFHEFDDIWITQPFKNRCAAFAVGIAAMHDGRDKAHSFVPVIARDCVGRLTLSLARNGRNAKDIILARHGGYREFKEVYIRPTKFAGDVTVELKQPTRFDGAERVEEHPQGRDFEAHDATGCLQIEAVYAKFEQLQVIWIILIVVLAHKLGPAIFLRKRCQRAELVVHSCSLQHLLLHLLAFLVGEELDFARMFVHDGGCSYTAA